MYNTKVLVFPVNHNELVTTLRTASPGATAAAVSVVKLDRLINPSASNLFPWLSAFADNFDMYEFDSLQFEYIPSCAMTAAGTLSMAIDYDPQDDAPADQNSIISMYGSVSGPITRGLTLRYDQNAKIQRTHRFYTGTKGDGRLNNVGRLVLIASSSGPLELGRFYVRYRIKLIAPQLAPPTVDPELILKRRSEGDVTPGAPFGDLSADMDTMGVRSGLSVAEFNAALNQTTQAADQLLGLIKDAKKYTSLLQDGNGFVGLPKVVDGASAVIRTWLRDEFIGDDPDLLSGKLWTFFNPETDLGVIDWENLTDKSIVLINKPGVSVVQVTMGLLGNWEPAVAGQPPTMQIASSTGSRIYDYQAGYAPSDWTFPSSGTLCSITLVFMLTLVGGKAWFAPAVSTLGVWAKAGEANRNGIRVNPYTHLDNLVPKYT